MISVFPLTEENFFFFFIVFRFDHSDTKPFQVSLTEENADGWRVAMMKVTTRELRAISCHPNTRETFEPIQGFCLVVVAESQKPEELKAFVLDAPVCIDKGIWHCVIALSDYAIVKVVENSTVDSKMIELPRTVRVCMTTAD